MNKEFPKAMKRERNTAATQCRTEKLKILIAEISTREMQAREIALCLKYSPSGSRKYIHDLRKAGVIELDRYIGGLGASIGKAVYKISHNAERVKAFLADIEQPKIKSQVKMETAAHSDKGSGGNGRHFHILADDIRHPVRVDRPRPVVHEPVLAHFFGLVPHTA